MRSARIAETQHTSHLVKRLTGGVVSSRPDDRVRVIRSYVQQIRVPSRYRQADSRKREVFMSQHVGVHVADDMIDTYQRHAGSHSDRFGSRDADQQTADQSGPVCYRNRRKIRKRRARVLQRLVKHRKY